MPATAKQKRSAAERNAALHKALRNPMRQKIMIFLTEREASPSQIAKALGETLGSISHHVRELADAGLVELVDIVPGKRGLQRIYKAVARPILEVDSWEQMPRLLREIASVHINQLIVGDLAEATKAGTFDKRPGRTQLRVPCIVDEEGWEKIEPISKRYLEEIFDVVAESSERLAATGEEGIPVMAVALAFEMPEPPPTALEPPHQ